MATIRPSGAGNEPVGTGEKINGGTVLFAGNVPAGSPITKAVSLDEISNNLGKSFGSKVIAKVGTGSKYTDQVGISGATAGNVIAGSTVLGYNAGPTEWVMMGGNVTTTLRGSAFTKLIGAAAGMHGANPTRDSINELETTRSLPSVTINVLAMPSSGINPAVTKTGGGVQNNYIDPAVAGGSTNSADSAANPTLAVPGELVYRYGASLPKLDNYKAKDSFES